MKKNMLKIIAVTALMFAFSLTVYAQVPIYQSSVVNNATSTRMEMTYNVSLANIVPAASAYSVMVNSVSRTVTAVAVSGTKVLLFLVSPVVDDDVMTVSYSRPGINPIQSVTGEQAASLTPQNVTNNVVAVTPVYNDNDGNSYDAIGIGFQIWMKENLKTTKYGDGTSIPNVTDNTTWAGLTSGAYCWYNNNATDYKATYGALYNWYSLDAASNGNKNLCPTGWHVPSDDEWTTLSDYLGGESVAGEKLKEAGTAHWISPNTGTNESGFTALPGGSRYLDGTFNGIMAQGDWWTSTDYHSTNPWMWWIYNYQSNFDNTLVDKEDGFSVRCLQNVPPIAEISGTTAVCKDAAQPYITFTGITGTAPFIFTYTINGGSIQTVTTYTYTIEVPTDTPGTYTYSLVSMQDAYSTVAQTGTAVVTVYPLPTANAGTALGAICQGGTSAALGGSVGGSATGGIWSTTAGGTFNPDPTALNATWTPPGTYIGTATLTLTTTGGSCGTATSNKTITVNQNPAITDMTSTICSGTGFTVTPVNGTNGIVPAGTTYSWAAPVVTGGVTGGMAGAAGPNISGTLTNPGNIVQTATYSVTPLSAGCPGPTFTVTITINPTPSISNGASSLCSGSFTDTPINLANGIVPTGTIYSWPIPSVTGGITGAASGVGQANINGTLNNPGNTSQTVIYTVTPTAGSCTGAIFTRTFTILPTPSINNLTAASCSATPFSVTPANGIDGIVPLGTKYVYLAPVVTGGMTGGTQGFGVANFSGTLINPTNTPQTATYTVSPQFNDMCTGTSFTVTVTVNPIPAVTAMTNMVCSGVGFTLTPVNISNGIVPGGTTYSWPAPSVTGSMDGGAAGAGASNISGNLTNLTGNVQTATYIVTPISVSCTGATFTVTITVNPLLTAPTVGTITQPTCSLATGSVVLSGLPATGTWTLTRN
ncbi:MAG: FISUMP domain-containing protein, partial [Bacteroidales bacterium]